MDYGDADIMPNMGGNNLSTELMLPKGGVMVKEGCVTVQKCDRDGNPIRLANDNPILDT